MASSSASASKSPLAGERQPGGRSLLLCVDGSEHSDSMVETVLGRFATAKDAVNLLIAWQEPDTGLDVDDNGFGGVMIMEVDREVERAAQRAALAVIKRLGKRCEELGHPARLLMVHGPPKYAITEFINEHPPDLVVVASRGHGAVGRFFLGSTSDYILHNAHCPVLLLKDKNYADALRAVAT